MDNNAKTIIIVVVGGVGVYLIWKGGYLQQWFPSLFAATTPTTTPAAGTTTTQTAAQLAAAAAAAAASGTALLAPATAIPATGATKTDSSGNLYTWNGTAWVFTAQTCPSGQHLMNGVCTPYAAASGPAGPTAPIICPTGQVVINGVCTPLAACSPGLAMNSAGVCAAISAGMLAAAIAAGEGNSLNMDQWDFYYQQVTGSAAPIDPGSISPGVYSGAGIVDRTTPTDIGTWLAIMQNQAPSMGLTGIGDLGYIRATTGWLT